MKTLVAGNVLQNYRYFWMITQRIITARFKLK